VALMLIYYVVMKLGLSAVQADRMGGVVVAFLPNILFTVLGAGLWWHNLRT
jgi:lipopolysaccharide export LptBFGC system permease protein LptF